MGRLIAVLGVVACVLLTGMTAAGAQSSDEQLDECLDISDEEMGMGPPSCTFDSQGNLISRDFGGAGPGQGIGFGTFLVIALVWGGIPLVIAAVIASGRNESMGTAVLLTLVLGWIGLGIVVFGQQRTVRTVSAAAGAAAAPAARAGSADAVAERLSRIDDLHAQGVITDDERAQRRDAVLNDL